MSFNILYTKRRRINMRDFISDPGFLFGSFFVFVLLILLAVEFTIAFFVECRRVKKQKKIKPKDYDPDSSPCDQRKDDN